ncbi:hypothetical protein [Streptomyces naphthomycinicus]|uniref:hypothetical protein n=1 Tax=Streptomyces naphthomycinicus TaxID=2872625 RepID=UPI001CED0434|nr:hypothetical protein [Streptomyces sp. TML10]
MPSEVLTRRPGARRGDLEPTDDPKTALTAVMGATGGVDLPLIASLLGTAPEEGGAAVAGTLRGLRPGPRGRGRPDRLAVRAAASGAGSAVEVAVDVARDAAGRWRHPARPHRVRTDISAAQVPPFGQ